MKKIMLIMFATFSLIGMEEKEKETPSLQNDNEISSESPATPTKNKATQTASYSDEDCLLGLRQMEVAVQLLNLTSTNPEAFSDLCPLCGESLSFDKGWQRKCTKCNQYYGHTSDLALQLTSENAKKTIIRNRQALLYKKKK